MTASRVITGLVLVAAGLGACSSDSATTQASVEFKLSDPLCGAQTPFGLTFLVDSVPIGSDSLHDNAVSPPYSTTPGSHRLSAYLNNDVTRRSWLDTTVILQADSVFVQTVGLYCS